MPEGPREARFPAAEVVAACAASLSAAGVPEADAAIAGSAIVEADLRGVPSHGVRLLPGYLGRLRAGGLNPRPRLSILREGPALALLDGDGGLGHVVATRAMEVAMARARSFGIGACAAGHSSHFGMAAVYAELAAREGMLGAAVSNSVAVMPPPGGAEARVGACAFAYALPGTEEALVADMAMSVSSRGRILVLAEEGRPLPGGWALDALGRPTTDPAVAADGLLLPAGGHKGFLLALLWDALAGILSGSRFGAGAVRPEAGERGDIGHFMLAVEPSFLGPPERFRESVDAVARSLRATRPREAAGEPVRAPGDRARLVRERNLREGLALPVSLAAQLGLG